MVRDRSRQREEAGIEKGIERQRGERNREVVTERCRETYERGREAGER